MKELLLALTTTTRLLTLLVGTLALLALGQWAAWVAARARTRARLPPGPFPLPVLGNLLHLLNSPSPHLSLARLAGLYGPVFFLRLGSSPTIVVSSPHAARHIFHTHDKAFAGRPPSGVFRSLFYGGDQAALTTSYGPRWRSIRQLYTTHFLSPHLIQHIHPPIIAQETRRLLRHLRDAVGSPVNLTDCLSDLMENIMCRLVLGRRVSDVSLVLQESGDAGKGKDRRENLSQLVREGNFLLGAGLIGDLIPLLGFLDYKTKRVMERWSSSFDAVLEAVLRGREAGVDDDDTPSGAAGRADVLDGFLSSQPTLSRDRIKAMALELIMAGINASTVTLDWAMAEILSNPRVLGKLQEETSAVVGKDRCVTVEDLAGLPYTRAVVRETLRKHTPGPFLIPHMSTEPCVLRLDERAVYEVPAGTRMLVNAWAIANDPSTWSDPGEYLPERFMQSAGPPGGPKRADNNNNNNNVDVYGQHFELLPFGSGRRMCPGIGLAMAVAELGVANLSHCFDWAVHGASVDMAEKFGLSLPRKAPLHAVPTRFRLAPSSMDMM